MESSFEQRRQEILAKKAKLAELKRQRELRREQGSSRQSMTASPLGEVGQSTHCLHTANTDMPRRYCHQHHDAARTSIAEPTSIAS